MKTKIFSLVLCITAVICLSGCYKEDVPQEPSKPELNKTKLTMYPRETFQLKYTGKNCTWKSDNSAIAKVENGLVTALYVGETTIYADRSKCKVTVKPHLTKYYDPYLEFGASKDKVKSYMYGYQIERENSESIIFTGKNGIISYLYRFENGILTGSGFLADLTEGTYVIDYVKERYIPMEQSGSTYYFMSPTKKFAVAVQITTSGVMVICLPTNSKTKSISMLFDNVF